MIALANNETITLTKAQFSVYKCIAYFDVFKYPVQPVQILEFINVNATQSQVNLILNELIELKLISEARGYYFLQNAGHELISKRLDSEKRFSKKQKTIQRYANFISRFPFVEAVCISGSCSKGLLEEDGDIDYFIITSPHKLWLCRSILVAFKKIFLFNSRKYFCINYLVASDNIQIPDHNVFVATEIKTLMPVNNRLLFEKFLDTNNWTGDFFPNRLGYNPVLLNERSTGKIFSKFIELIFSGKTGEMLDKKCFEWTLASWQKKFPGFSKADFDLNLRSRKNVSKHHPRGYQQKVLAQLEERLEKVKILTS